MHFVDFNRLEIEEFGDNWGFDDMLLDMGNDVSFSWSDDEMNDELPMNKFVESFPCTNEVNACSDSVVKDSNSSKSNVGIKKIKKRRGRPSAKYDLLKVPIKALSLGQKQDRRRAQIAQSARRHRERLKEEYDELLCQYEQLQKQVDILQDQRSKRKKILQHNSPSTPKALAWEYTAKVQLQQRKAAEEMNAHLIQLVTDQNWRIQILTTNSSIMWPNRSVLNQYCDWNCVPNNATLPTYPTTALIQPFKI